VTPFDGFLSGARSALFVRNLVLRALNRPRLKVEAHVGNVWIGGTQAPPTLVVSVANPSPHPLVLSHIGIEIGRRGDAGFPEELKTILGPLAQFNSRSVSMTMEALEEFIGRHAEHLLPVQTVRIVCTDGLGKEWFSKVVKTGQD
jgi:hypothetical protein